jgi:hypothetical protein
MTVPVAQEKSGRVLTHLWVTLVTAVAVAWFAAPEWFDADTWSARLAEFGAWAWAIFIVVSLVRGLLERNTVRYYLAVDAYLDALRLPREQQLERRLLDWFAATEQHPQQLRELDWETYVQMKRLEVKRQQDRPPGRR